MPAGRARTQRTLSAGAHLEPAGNRFHQGMAGAPKGNMGHGCPGELRNPLHILPTAGIYEGLLVQDGILHQAWFSGEKNAGSIKPTYQSLDPGHGRSVVGRKEALIDIPAAFQKMKDLDLKVVLATNNATQTAAQFVEKVRSFGVELEPEQIINSPMAVADILEQRFPGGGPVYVFGEEGIRTTLKEHGYYHAEKNVLAVVVGLNRQATFADFCAATSLIRGGAPFIGTNPDKTFPQPNGTVIPGGGAFVAFFEASTDVKPTIAGKPFPFLFNLALKRLSISPRTDPGRR